MALYEGSLFHAVNDLPHPNVMHARAVREFDRALAALISRTTADATAAGINPEFKQDFDLVRLWQETLYRATELFDTYTAHIPTALGSKADKHTRQRLAPYVAAAKARRSVWANMCNRLKHNHHVLIPHRTRYASGRTVDGFRVSKHDAEGVLRGAIEFHKHAQSISFGVAIREILHDVLRTDVTCSKMVGSKIGEGSAIMKETFGTLPLLPDWPNYYETGQRSSVALAARGLNLTRTLLVPIREDSRQSTVNTADGFTTTFELP